MNRKILTVTGDDFGYCESVNNGIIEAYKKGILRNVSLMATGEGFDHAIQLLKENPGISAGVHVALVASKPVTHPDTVPSLCGSLGNLPSNYLTFAAKLFTGRIDLSDVEREIHAQIGRIVANGVTPTHIDSHQHVHILPRIWEIVAKTAIKNSIPFIRIPLDQVALNQSHKIRPVQILKHFTTLPLLKKRRVQARQNGLNTCDHFHGLMVSGHLTQEALNQIIKSLDPGIHELMCHPGYPPPENDPAHAWKYRWEDELEALTSVSTHSLLESSAVEIKNFSQLQSL